MGLNTIKIAWSTKYPMLFLLISGFLLNILINISCSTKDKKGKEKKDSLAAAATANNDSTENITTIANVTKQTVTAVKKKSAEIVAPIEPTTTPIPATPTTTPSVDITLPTPTLTPIADAIEETPTPTPNNQIIEETPTPTPTPTLPPLTVDIGSNIVTNIPYYLKAEPNGAEFILAYWTQKSGPGVLTFSDPTAADPAVSADIDGEYIIELIATALDGREAHNELIFHWDTTAPTVDIIVPTGAISGAITPIVFAEDIFPISYKWSQLSGTGTLQFSNSQDIMPTFTVDMDGTYTVRLEVSDKVGNKREATVSIAWDNTLPTVDAGADIATGTPTQLSGSVTDQSTLTYSWTMENGPGIITFSDPSSLRSTVSASQWGTYTLRLTAQDTASNISFDEMVFKWTAIDKQWDFSDLTQYNYDPQQISVIDQIARLYAQDVVDPDLTQDDFSIGTFTNSWWNPTTDCVTLTTGGLTAKTGIYRSRVFDAQAPADWRQIAWTLTNDAPFQMNLPDYKQLGDGFSQSVDMAGNTVLLHFDEGDGETRFINTAGSNLSITCTTCPKSGETGVVGPGAAQFSAAPSPGTHLIIADDLSLRPIGSNITISSWIMQSAFSNMQYIVEKGQDDTYDSYAFFIFNNHLAVEYNDEKGVYRYIESSYTPNITNNWMHLAVVFDAATGQIRFYGDGVLKETKVLPALMNTTYDKPLYIGKQNFGSNHMPLQAKLDELAIFNRALSTAEVSELFYRGSSRIDIKVRSCLDATCSANPTFVGPDNTANSFFSGVDGEGNLPSMLGKQYFQYEATLKTSHSTLTPGLKSVSFITIPNSAPILAINQGQPYQTLTGFYEYVTPAHVGTTSYQLSPDGTRWFYHNGTTWVQAANVSQSNGAAAINSKISTFPSVAGVGTLYWRAFFQADNNTGLIRLVKIRVTGSGTP